jgi:hypothetical protein
MHRYEIRCFEEPASLSAEEVDCPVFATLIFQVPYDLKSALSQFVIRHAESTDAPFGSLHIVRVPLDENCKGWYAYIRISRAVAPGEAAAGKVDYIKHFCRHCRTHALPFDASS